MKISTRGRYAVRVMLDLAENDRGAYIPLMDVAGRQEISEKYLESIVSVLSRNHFVISLRGKGGGYRLARTPGEYTVGSILRAAEGSLAPAACLKKERRPAAAPLSAGQKRCGRGFTALLMNILIKSPWRIF